MIVDDTRSYFGMNKITTVLVLACIFLAGCGGSDTYVPNKTGIGWGFIDKKGYLIVPPQFEAVQPYTEGLAAVVANGHWGFVDAGGNMVIAPRFENAQQFSGGYAAVSDHDKWGFIDNKGHQVIGFNYDDTKPFSKAPDHIAAVKNGEHWGFVDDSGRAIRMPIHCFDCMPFSEGYAAVKDDKYLWGFIDLKGKLISECKYLSVTPFTDGVSEVHTRDNRYGLMDPNGLVVYKEQSELPSNFS
ncbi:MAG: WG repeat-containing protein, partial [Terriglobales bacterium]